MTVPCGGTARQHFGRGQAGARRFGAVRAGPRRRAAAFDRSSSELGSVAGGRQAGRGVVRDTNRSLVSSCSCAAQSCACAVAKRQASLPPDSRTELGDGERWRQCVLDYNNRTSWICVKRRGGSDLDRRSSKHSGCSKPATAAA